MSNSHLFLKSTFVNAPLQNGVGRYICQLQRVTLKFCKNNGSSRGMRDFIESDLVNYAKENPGTVVYLKPRRHRGATIVAEYLNGDKQHVDCRNLEGDTIAKWLNLLKTQSGNHENVRFRKMWHTENPSIQGPWTPYTFREPELNLVEFPSEQPKGPEQLEQTATEKLLEIFKAQKAKNEQPSIEDLEANRAK